MKLICCNGLREEYIKLSALFLVNVLNNNKAPINIRKVSKKNFIFGSNWVNPNPPKKKINALWINKYKESNPRIPGVKIGLLVNVWNSKVDTPIA